jgi:hypothetical protein
MVVGGNINMILMLLSFLRRHGWKEVHYQDGELVVSYQHMLEGRMVLRIQERDLQDMGMIQVVGDHKEIGNLVAAGEQGVDGSKIYHLSCALGVINMDILRMLVRIRLSQEIEVV